MARTITDDEWRRIKLAGRILGGVTGTAVGVAGFSVALLLRQAADARRIIPVAEAPPPRGDGVYGAKFPGQPLSMVILGDSTGAGYGVLRTHPATRKLLTDATTEIRDVAVARGIHLAEDVVARTLAWIDGIPADGTTSLQRDLIAGRPSELDAWTGAVVRLGNEAGVPTPVNAFLYDLATARALAAGN